MSEVRKPLVMNGKLLVMTALKMEARAIERVIGDSARVEVIGLRGCRLRGDWASGNPSCVIMVGLGGGLDPALNVGDLVLDDPAGLVAYTLIRRGSIHTAEKVITSAAEKQALWKRTGSIVGDMESEIVRRAADGAKIPYIGLRAVSDRADQAIDKRVIGLVDEVGNPRPIAVAKLLARHPGMIGQLRELQRQAEIALAALAGGVREIIDELGRR